MCRDAWNARDFLGIVIGMFYREHDLEVSLEGPVFEPWGTR
jgi:hypothetical protein